MNRPDRGLRPSGDGLESRALLSAVHPARPLVEREKISLTELNGSGVTGSGTLVLKYTGPGTDRHLKATLTLKVSGLEAGQVHPVTVNGNPASGKLGQIPPSSAATLDPSADGLGTEIISMSEADPYTGPALVKLDPIEPNRRGALPKTIHRTFSAIDDPSNSAFQVLVVCGETVQGTYQTTVPVAAVVITKG